MVVEEKAVRWLKKRGINPHLARGGIREVNALNALEFGNVAFDPQTGEISVPKTRSLANIMKRGIDEHELFHRGDFLEKFGPTRKTRKTVREKWEDVRKMLAEMEKYERYIDEDHPLRIARDMLISQGYDPLESMLALWRKSPEQFKRILKLATAAHIMEKRGQASEKTRRMKRFAQKFFSGSPKKASRVQTIYHISTEIPAYMITAMIEGKRPEKGIAIARAKLASEKYFGGTTEETSAKKMASTYLRIAKMLRSKGLNDEQIARGIIALHKNVYSPEYAEMLADNRKMIKTAAEAVKLGLFKAEEIRTALAAQALGRWAHR